jgi:phosphonate transport system permease protein
LRLSTFTTVDNRKWLTIILIFAFVWSLASVEWNSSTLHTGGLSALRDILGSAFTPRIGIDVFRQGLIEAWTTVAYAVAGLTVALVLGVPLGVVGSGILARRRWVSSINVAWARFVLAFFRSVHELVWAWMFIVAVGLSPMAAVLAIGIPYAGILGRVFAELLKDVPDEPLDSLRSAGASEWNVFLYGRLPIAMPDILSYTFYRLECGIRAAAVMSFVGLGGLGQQVQLSLQDLDYSRAWTFLFFLIALVALIDLWSSIVRKRVAS